MKKFISVFISFIFILLFSTAAFPDDHTYSKFAVGAGFGDLNACLNPMACADEETKPELDTKMGYLAQIVPIAFKTNVAGNFQMAFEPTFFVGHREFDLETQEGNYTYKIDGDNTDYGFMGNMIGRFNLNNGISPFVGAGVGVKYSTFDIDASCTGEGESHHGCRSFNGQLDPHSDFVRVWTFLAGVETSLVGDLKGGIQYNYFGADRVRDIAISSQGNANLDGEHTVSLFLAF